MIERRQKAFFKLSPVHLQSFFILF